jgi:hypothetical protein
MKFYNIKNFVAFVELLCDRKNEKMSAPQLREMFKRRLVWIHAVKKNAIKNNFPFAFL